MLMKADGSRQCAEAFANWRAMLPYWNGEADRVRRVALAARAGETVHGGVVDEIEALSIKIRQAMEYSDSLMTMTSSGNASLSALLGAGAEFEALLDSLQTSLEMLESVADRSQARPAQVIPHRIGQAVPV